MENLIDRVMEIVSRSKDISLEKQSHEGKSLKEHIEECFKLAKELVELIYHDNDGVYKGFVKDYVSLLCILHDIGKALPSWDISNKERPLHAVEGAEYFLREQNIFKEVLVKLAERLGQSISSEDLAKILAYSIFTHHGALYTDIEIGSIIRKAEGRPRYFEMYEMCRKYLANVNTGIKPTIKQLRPDLKILLADSMGIMKLADIVSAINVDHGEIINQYRWNLEVKDITEIEKKIERRALNRTSSFDIDRFREQQCIASLSRRNIILIAPTGWGKTNVALLRALNLKPLKVIYVLPTITAIKELYNDMSEIFSEENIGEYFYFLDADLIEKGEKENINYIYEYYKYFIPKIIITTIDQLLFMMLQVGRYYLRRFNLNNSLVVLDEYHLLSPQMLAMLKVFVEKFSGTYKLSLLLMSATPNYTYIDHLKEVLGRDLETYVLREAFRKLRRHRVKLVEKDLLEFIEEQEVLEILKSKRVLIIVNTVRKAQEAFLRLKRKLENRKVAMIHSRFTYKDRVEIEEKLRDVDVLIATQVAEVSLDISFEVLITELAPIPSLIQRFGRVNRYGEGLQDEYNVYICCNVKNSEPYDELEVSNARRAIDKLIEGLEKKGEEIYLDRNLWNEVFAGIEIRGSEEDIKKKLEDMEYFFSFSENGGIRLQRLLGREVNVLAIPENLIGEIRKLKRKIKETSNKRERIRLYAELKRLFIPVPLWDSKRQWNDELNLYEIRRKYSNELGLVYLDENLM